MLNDGGWRLLLTYLPRDGSWILNGVGPWVVESDTLRAMCRISFCVAKQCISEAFWCQICEVLFILHAKKG